MMNTIEALALILTGINIELKNASGINGYLSKFFYDSNTNKITEMWYDGELDDYDFCDYTIAEFVIAATRMEKTMREVRHMPLMWVSVI